MVIEKKETEDEPQQEDMKEEENQEEKEDESEKTKEQEEVEETKPKTRRSFRLFKRKQTDKKAVKDEEKVVASEEPDGEGKETPEEVEKENIAEEDKKEIINDVEKEDTQDQEINEAETEKTEEQEEMLEQASELNTKPKLRRSFNLFRKRPVSMSAADRSGTDKDEEKFLSRDDPIRHSYHAGDLPVPDPTNLREYPHTIF